MLLKDDLVYVGGFAMWLYGLRVSYSDLDVVVTDLKGLEGAKCYSTPSPHSISGKRAHLVSDKIKIDIFIESNLPEWQMVKGFKCQTVPSMISHYERLLGLVHNKSEIIEKINTLKSWREKI